jgi:glycosyltransferase involved in cell wall biosynthesis
MSVAVLIPCFGDGSRLRAVLLDIASAFAARDVHVVVVDDGNAEPIAWSGLAELVTPTLRIALLRHAVNLGQGAALETARRYALRFGPEVVVTFDADGQHRAEDALALVAAVEAGAAAALGNRFAGGSNVPPLRRALLHAARGFERLLTGRTFGDAHNGLRALRGDVAARLVIRHARMAHGTEILLSLARMLPMDAIVEVPVRVHYSLESMAKGQSSLGSLVIVRDLLTHALFPSP